MATLQTLNDGEAGLIVRGKINDNFTAVNSDLSTLDTNKLEASDIATINGNTISAGGNLVIPVLTDGDKGDITLTSSGTVWTIDNNVVTNSKLGTTATNTIKGRSTAGTGNVEDLTPTQVAGMLPVATTSVAGTMSASDKTKLDSINDWTLLTSSAFTAGGSYASGTLTTYDEYKIFIISTTTGSSADLRMRVNSYSSAGYSKITLASNSGIANTSGDTEWRIFLGGVSLGSGFPFIGEYYLSRTYQTIKGSAQVAFDASASSTYLLNGYVTSATPSSVQLTTISNISGTIKIYGRNY